VQGWHPNHYGRVQRNGESYVATERFTHRIITVARAIYRRQAKLDQTSRLLRDLIEWALRRYHGYAIKERMRAHYRDASVTPQETTGVVFEHVLPVRYVVGLFLTNKISAELAMNPPTCVLRKSDHDILESQGLGDSTPDVWRFWQRYQTLDIAVITHDNHAVDISNWTLASHCDYFGIPYQK
jgi:hypothetical protein